MVLALENYYLSKGYGYPKYSYIHLMDDKGLKKYCAELILPTGITLRGDPSHSYAEVTIIVLLLNLMCYLISVC